MTHAIRALQNHDLSGDEINSVSHMYFFTTQGHVEPLRMRDQLNVGATSETTLNEIRYTPGTHSFILTRQI